MVGEDFCFLGRLPRPLALPAGTAAATNSGKRVEMVASEVTGERGVPEDVFEGERLTGDDERLLRLASGFGGVAPFLVFPRVSLVVVPPLD